MEESQFSALRGKLGAVNPEELDMHKLRLSAIFDNHLIYDPIYQQTSEILRIWFQTTAVK